MDKAENVAEDPVAGEEVPESSEKEHTFGTSDGGGDDQVNEGSNKEKEIPAAAMVARRVVHVVPVEQEDGSIVHYVIRLAGEEKDGEIPGFVDLEILTPKEPGVGVGMPLNPHEMEGMYLDRDVKDVREIVSMFQPKSPKENSDSKDEDRKGQN